MNSKEIKPKHCSQLIIQTLIYSKIFRNRKDSYQLSPGDLFDLTKELCNPFVSYSDKILLIIN